MAISTIAKSRITKISVAIFWIAAWQIASLIIGEALFLPSPYSVLVALFQDIRTLSFWNSILFSLSRVSIGFISALALAVLLSYLSYKSNIFELFIEPLVKVVRATPVASIVILVLVWVRSKNLSIIISMMIVLPVFYTNLLTALKSQSKELEEMAEVYRIRRLKKLRYVMLPQILPYLSSALSTALGLGWKSAIAAEVIGLPRGSIGERLYEAKLYLATPSLFSWTLVIILLAVFFEKALLFVIDRLCWRICK